MQGTQLQRPIKDTLTSEWAGSTHQPNFKIQLSSKFSQSLMFLENVILKRILSDEISNMCLFILIMLRSYLTHISSPSMFRSKDFLWKASGFNSCSWSATHSWRNTLEDAIGLAISIRARKCERKKKKLFPQMGRFQRILSHLRVVWRRDSCACFKNVGN